MLDLLRKLAQQQGVSSKLCSLGVIAILRSLQENGSPSVQCSANRTLKAVIQSDVTPVLQPLSPNNISAQYPSSTCQSNSPSVPQAQHQHRHFERDGEKHDRLSSRSTQSHKHTASSADKSATSQAFGSQQGAADDQHIFDLNVRLQYSDDTAVLLQALQELRSVTAADMPPEAILQRPSVLQHVLALLQPADKASSLPKATLQFLLCFVRRIKWALGMAADPDVLPVSTGGQPPVHSVSNIAEEALHLRYPPPQSAAKPPGGSLPSSAVARALAAVTAVEDNALDILSPAHSIAVHALKLLQNPLHQAEVLLLMQELTSLLLPPAPEVLQPAGLQRFKQYFDITSEALKALQAESVTAQAKEPRGSVKAGTNCFDWTALDAASAGVLTLAGRLCQQVDPHISSQVLPAYLANSLGALACDPFASACMPALMPALLPHLHHLQPASAHLLHHVATAAQQAKQLAAVLDTSSQVKAGGIDAASWLHDATLALPALDHLAEAISQQAVATLLDALLETPALCSPLSGSFAKTAHFINSLLTSHLPHVQLAAHQALVGATCIGPAALRVRTHGLLCHSTVLDTLMTQGLAEAASKLCAAQLVQAVAVEGAGDEGQSCLMPWMMWLACYEHDHAIGGTIAGVINILQNWRTSQQGFSQWEQAQPHLISLFRRQPSARQAASHCLASQLGLTEALRQLPDKAGNAQVAQDPFSKLLDGGVTAQVTAACASRVSSSFSGKDVHQLKSILCMPSLNPDIRRAAADQLLSLAPNPRFAQCLSDTTVLHTLLGELTTTDNGLGYYEDFAEATAPDEAEGSQQLQQRLPGCANAQLPISCLHLLVALVQHCSEVKAVLLQGADRLLAPLLPLIFSPLTTIRRGMANLLTHLIFASAHTAQQASGGSHKEKDSGALTLLLSGCFLHHFSFPCKTACTQSRVSAVGDKDASHCAQVMKALQQQQMLQAAGGIEGLVALLQTSPGTNALPADTLASYAAMMRRTLPAVVVPAALKKVKDAHSHEECLQALQHLQMLCSRHTVAVAVAAANWAPALQHLLSQAPVTAEDKHLWLHLLPVVDTLLGSHAVQPSALHLLALCMRQAAMPVLGSIQAVKGPPSLPLALTHHTDAACIFSEAQQQLTDIEVTQVTLATLTSLLQEAQLSSQPTTCSDILHAIDAPALITLLCSATITNTEAAYGSRTAALHLLTQLNACIRLTWDSTPSAVPGSEWDSAVVAAIGGIVRHVCMPNHDTRLGGFKGKQLLRQALACLKEVVGALPVELWSEAWQQVGGTFWMTRLSRDREASVRVTALGLLAHLASPRAPATRRMLLQGWPEAATALLKVVLQKEEPLAVRAAALRFLAVAMTISSSEAAHEAQQMKHASHQSPGDTHRSQPYSDPASPDRSSLLASAPASPHVQRPAMTTEAASSGLALVPVAHDGLLQSSGYPDLQAVPVQDFAGPLFLQSDFAARQYTQGVWDFGVEQLLLQGSFWEQLPDLLQGTDVTPSYMMALTAVLLQAAIADPDLVQAHLADQHCWPALLAVCKPEPTTSALQHAHRLTQLAYTHHNSLAHFQCFRTTPHHLPSPHTSADLSPEPVCADVADGTAAFRSNAKQQEPTPGRSSSHRSTTAVDLVEGDLSHAQHAASTAGAASHVAQIITVMVQSQAVEGDTAPGYAGLDTLQALLHCYSVHAQAASCQLPEPVWPVQTARQKQQQAMLQHVAQAGAAVLAGGHVSCSQLSSILPTLPNAFCLAAAALHAPASVMPLPTKLASCKLLALLMPTQDIADVVLSKPPGDAGTEESVGSCLCSGLAATYLELCTDGQLVLDDAIADRACAAAALRCLLAFSQDAKAQATSIGLHQLLLNCVADTHALLALKAFQPSHQQTSAAIVPTPHSDFMQAKAAGKLPSHGKGARFRQKGTKELHRAKAGAVTAKAPSKVFQPSTGPPELLSLDSESSLEVHSTSLVQPNSEATATRQQLLIALSLLKHLAHNSPAACEAIVAAGVMDTVRRTWKMALGHDGLLHEVLGLLANLFPGCPSAQKAFASSGNPSLPQRILTLVNKPSLDLPTLELGMATVANLAGSAEGCLLLLRSPLLAKTEQQLHHLLQRRDGPRVAAFLEPLINLAAHAEGQKQILRCTSAPGLLDLALTAAHMHHAAASAKALFLLRNLALAAGNKVHFVTNPRALPVLLAAAARAGHNAEAGAYAASALWALVHQGEKVKASLRSLPHAQAQLQEAEAACFGCQRMQVQQKADVVNAAGDRHNTQALQALQMLLLLLEFPKD
ncbi:TPA: hypothetical protein ACH3X1_013032 [Trebouxia sp. C0004]